MLNKLSFNIFNELNESETNTYKIKKKVLIENDGPKTIQENKSVCEKCGKEPCECNKILNEEDEFILLNDMNNISEFDKASLVQGNGDLLMEETAEELGISEDEALEKQIQEFNVKLISKEPAYNGNINITVEGTPSNVLKFFSNGEFDNAIDFSNSYELDVKILNMNENISNDKEERLASLKIQLEKDGDQLAADEREAIEKEIEELEKEVIKEDENLTDTFIPADEDDIQVVLDYYPEATEEQAKMIIKMWNEENDAINYDVELTYKTIDDWLKVSSDNGWGLEDMLWESNMNEDSIIEPEGIDIKKYIYQIKKAKSNKLTYEDFQEMLRDSMVKDRFLDFDKDTDDMEFINKWVAKKMPERNNFSESSLKEEYSEKFGGDPEDFVSDVQIILNTLNNIDISSFGTHLAQQIVEDWIETCERQIEKGKRLASGDEFYSEDSMTEAEEMNVLDDIIESLPDSIKNNFDIEKQGNSLKLSYKDNNTKFYYFISPIKNMGSRTIVTSSLEGNIILYNHVCSNIYDLNELLNNDFNKTFKKDSMTEAEEMNVKGLKVVKEQGNIYMLEDENKKIIVGENYDIKEGIIENAEIYENKNEADKDYLDRCEIIKESSKMNEDASNRYQVREFDGPGAKFGVYDTKSKKFVQKGSKKVMTAACNDLNKSQK